MSAMLPEYPVSREEKKEQLDSALPASEQPDAAPDASAVDAANVPSQLTFAQEVRAERLSILWKVTLFASFMIWWVLIVISGGREMSYLAVLAPTGIVTLGCIGTGQFLKRERFNDAVWVYSLGAIIAIALTMGLADTFGEQYAPYIFPVLVFVVGLLMPMRDTFTMAAIVVGAAIAIPSAVHGELVFTNTTLFALILTGVSTALSAQVSGELYAIAEWALENYRKERQTTFALFESREALQKSFMRQQALTMEVQKANKELEVARKAEEEAKNFRGQFLANMSHELRTPLNAIIGFSQTMLDFPAMYDLVELPLQYRKDMTQILSSGKHLLNIINDILDLSKVDAGKLDLEIQPVDLGPVIKGVLSTAVGLVGEKADRVKLTRKLGDPLPMVMGDPLRVRQVLLNLYSNAAKFTDSGHIRLLVYAENDQVIFGVEDTGIGITDADKVSIFEEFRQGTAGRKKGRQGAGLGLAISQQLLRLMNGRMWFESVLGKGSTFYFALPLYVPKPDEAGSSSVDDENVPDTPPARTTKLKKPAALADAK